MADELVRGIVRILNAEGRASGTGFLVSADGLIASCAHVVGERGEVDVAFRGSSELRRARVEPGFVRSATDEDVAFLRLLEAVPEGISPLRLSTSAHALGHEVRTFGYPEAMQLAGMWGTGKVVGTTQQGGHAMLQLAEASDITRGFSGAPVIDTTTRCVIGMVSAITAVDEYGRQSGAAFLTPSETLQQVCPGLVLARTSIGGRFLKGLQGDPLPALRERTVLQSELWLRENTGARRYIPQVFGARPAMQAAVAAFLEGEHAGFVLTGDSGIGKTTLLCHLLEEWRGTGQLVVAFQAQNLEIERPLEERILLDLHLSAAFMDLIDFLQASEKKLIVLVDGVNEHPAALRLLQQLSNFIQRYAATPAGAHRPSLKVILSFRTGFLDKLIETLPAADWDESRLFPKSAFAQHEIAEPDRKEGSEQRTSYRFELAGMDVQEIGAAYEAYRSYRETPQAPQRHCPTTPFSELDADWHPVLANPFYLRLLVEAYHGKVIPAQPWHGELMRAFCELRIWGSEADGVRYAARAALIDELVSAMRRQQAASLRKDTLHALSPQWELALRADQPAGSPYRQLLDDGVLMETTVREQSGRGTRTRLLVRFSFDTLFEYLLGDDILREAGGWDRLGGAHLAVEVERSKQFPYLAGAVEHLLLEAVDACNFMPLVELFGVLDADARVAVYEALSPQVTVQETPSGKFVVYDRTGTHELFARLHNGRFIHGLLWKLYEWGDQVSRPLSTMVGPTRGRGRRSRWHRNFKHLFAAIEAGADPRAAFNIVLWMAGRAGLMKDDQLTPLCQQTAIRLRSDRIDATQADRSLADERAAVLLVQADALSDTGHLDAAIEMARQACARLEELVTKAPALNGQLAEGWIHLAALHGRSNQLPQTIETSRAAAWLLRDLPQPAARHKELLLNALAFERQALQTQDADADVEDLLNERIQLMRELVGSHGLEQYRRDLVETLMELSACAADGGEPQQALQLVTEAVELCRPQDEMAEAEPREPSNLADLLPTALVLQGLAFERSDDAGAAYQAMGEAIGIWGALVKEGDDAAVRFALLALTDRSKLCATLSHWDLVAADVVAAFSMFIEACNVAEPPKATMESFRRMVTFLRRLSPDDQSRLCEELGPENAEVVQQYFGGA